MVFWQVLQRSSADRSIVSENPAASIFGEEEGFLRE
jgi:hypothetical protein